MDINQALTNAAKTDMRIARKSGVLAITDTKQGMVELTYEAAAKEYKIAAFHGGALIASGKAGHVAQALKNLYTVVS